MTDVKEIKYQKAYVELYKMILNLPKTFYEKIPEKVINNIKKSGDESYSWDYDTNKDFESQNIMIETKALIVQIYRNYLMDPSEKEKWEKYDIICKKVIEEEKAQKYDPSNVFGNSSSKSRERIIRQMPIESTKVDEKKNYLILMEEESTFRKIINLFKEKFRKLFGKDK